MTSALVSIYNAIAAWTPTHKVGVSVPCWDLTEIKDTGTNLIVPMRILLAEAPETSGEDFHFIALGKLAKVTWYVTDLFLMRLVTQTPTHRDDVDRRLIDYEISYLDAMIADRSPTSQSYIETARMKPGVYAWPLGSEIHYHGVEVILAVNEIV